MSDILLLLFILFYGRCQGSVLRDAYLKGSGHHQPFSARQDVRKYDHCSSSNSSTYYMSDILSHFTGIILGDFTSRGVFFPGPLAVGGTYDTLATLINANHYINCSADINTNVRSYGLVVGGEIRTYLTSLGGNAFLSSKVAPNQVKQELSGCQIFMNGTGIVDFDRIQSALYFASETLAKLDPDLKLEANGTVTALRPPVDPSYHVFTFATCNGNCSEDPLLSDPSKVFFGHDGWSGPIRLPVDATIVINIPVNAGKTITLNTTDPSAGFYSCKTIYNLYPVDNNGNYNSSATFTIDRVTLGFVEGLILAPQAHIREGPNGGFGGQLFAGTYSWIDRDNGANVRDYIATTDTCPQFQGCFPLELGREIPDTDLPGLDNDDEPFISVPESYDDGKATSSASNSNSPSSSIIDESSFSLVSISSESAEFMSASETETTSIVSQRVSSTDTVAFDPISTTTAPSAINFDNTGSTSPNQPYLTTQERTVTVAFDVISQVTMTTTEAVGTQDPITYAAPTVTLTVTDVDKSFVINTESEVFTRTLYSVDYLNNIHTLTELVSTTRTHIDTETHTDFHSDVATIVLPGVTVRYAETMTQQTTTTMTVFVPVLN